MATAPAIPKKTRTDTSSNTAITTHHRSNRIIATQKTQVRDANKWKQDKDELKKDLSEKNDLAQSMPDKAKALNDKLSAWLKASGAKMPQPRAAKPKKPKKPKK